MKYGKQLALLCQDKCVLLDFNNRKQTVFDFLALSPMKREPAKPRKKQDLAGIRVNHVYELREGTVLESAHGPP